VGTEQDVRREPVEAGPVQAGERLEFVDILRGFAILGILVANMASYSGMSNDLQTWTEPVDRAILLLTRFFVEAKFYSLFSFLFGWGMAVQMMRAESRGGRFAPLYLRRLLILLALGLLHAFLIWNGDILAVYALIGCLLMLVRRRSSSTLLVMAALSLLFAIVIILPGEATTAFRTWYERVTGFLRSGTYPQSLYTTGTYGQITRLRVQDYLSANSWFIYWIGNLFAMFLLGLYVGKRRIFHEIDRHQTLLRSVLVVGLFLGVVFNGLYVLAVVRPDLVPAGYGPLATRGARTIGAPALMLFYVAAIILLVKREDWHRRLAPLASVGRSALSNYLLQSVLCTLLFYGYGLGLYEQVDPLLGLILTITLFLFQVQLSNWWFTRYRFGPMEWLWRSLTYGRLQPMRHQAAPEGWAGSLRRRAGRTAHRVGVKRALVLAWILLLIWGGGLTFWHLRLERALPQPVIEVPRAGAGVAVVPDPAGSTSQQGNSSPEVGGEVVATPAVQPVAYEPGPLAAAGDLWALASAFDVESAQAQIERLTGPPFLGRYTGSPEAWAAGDYIAEQFARYGLQPAGDDGSFFQSFPVEYIALAEAPQLVVEGPDGAVYNQYRAFQDFSPMVRWYSGAGTAEGEVVWANDCTPEDLALVGALGKIALCRNQSLQEIQRNALEHGAAGLLVLTEPEQRMPDFGNTYFGPWVPEPIPVYYVFPSAADELLLGSGKSVEDLSVSFTPFALQTQAYLEVQATGAEACPAQGCQGRNVLGVIPGRDPAAADQVIILGAHYDHIGQAPGGIVWPGANDDASGVAVLLEIARTWQEQGYVPRHTVLFAAWDAEEVGLIGASHYVEHPRYPLEDTQAMIQLDMVGSGTDTLWIDGGGELGEHLDAVARALDVETAHTDHGRSDHVPFMYAGVPANLLIWRYDEGVPTYHRPVDTAASIELDKLEVVGQIVGLTVLGLTEGDPAVEDLLARRAAAVEAGDLSVFLETSLKDQVIADRLWFEDVQSLGPRQVEMAASDVRILGRAATAMVQTTVRLPSSSQGEDAEAQTASLAARFVHDGQGWRWAGPDLVWAEDGAGFAVAYPPGRERGLVGLGEVAAERYAAMAARLGLPPRPDAAVLLLPDPESLRASTAPSLSPDRDHWVGPGMIKLTYSPEISASQKMTDTLAQLLLAEAGVTEEAAPWLWQGLPLALGTPSGSADSGSGFLPDLQTALAEEDVPLTRESAWAAVDYVRERIGWQGMGQLITKLGQACRDGLCAGPDGLNLALSETLGLGTTAFEAAWQGHWRGRLETVQAGLDALLAARTGAILAGDETAFLATVDANVPHLLVEEEHWFADLLRHPPQSFSLTGRPLALSATGDVLAQVVMEIQLPESAGRQGEARVVLDVRFADGGEGYRWAGVPLETLEQGRVRVLYPEGQQMLARALGGEMSTAYDQLATRLDLVQVDSLTFKLYGDDESFRASISPLLSPGERLVAWSERGESLRIRLSPGATAENLRGTLAVQLVRHLLVEQGVDSEWLLKGVSLYLSEELDGGASVQAATRKLHKVLEALPKEGLYDLEAMPPDGQLSPEDVDLARAQAWDTIRYLVYTHGWEALVDMVLAQARGLNASAALNQATGLTLPEFEAAWAESLAQAHAPGEWIEIANAFDPAGAKGHVEALADPQLAGRLAGSAGAVAAASYIADQFAQAGLLPAGELPPGDLALEGGTTFFQTLPITHAVLLTAPLLEMQIAQGEVQASFVYRQDFVIPAETLGHGGEASGELVWIREPGYGDMELAGKIVVRRVAGSADADAAAAAAYGAEGLILVGEKESPKQLLAKRPVPSRLAPDSAIPVLELTQQGFERLLTFAGLSDPRDLDAAPALPLGVDARLAIPIDTPQVVETANVLGLLPGSDPVLAREVIILGAHYDHVGDDPAALLCSTETPGSGGHAPSTTCEVIEGRHYAGANDDASGVGVLLETARLWQETGYRPKRSILFAAWGAQEAGQIGSSYYVEHPVLPLDQTVVMLQLDSVGGGRGYYLEVQGGGDPEGLLLFNFRAAEDWVDGRLSIRARWGESDQVPFREAGVPSVLITWRESSEDNWPVELADEVEPKRLGVTGRMVTLAVMALAR
jgi:uncharacterized protein